MGLNAEGLRAAGVGVKGNLHRHRLDVSLSLLSVEGTPAHHSSNADSIGDTDTSSQSEEP